MPDFGNKSKEPKLNQKTPKPVSITLHQQSRMLEINFEDNSSFEMSCEYLRVYSPSAETRGHGAGQKTFHTDKQNVNIDKLEPVGNYAIKIHFDDGHSTGLYSWTLLYELGINKEKNWQDYLDALEQADHRRQP